MSERLDVALFRRGMAPSREKAKDMVLSGLVTVDGRPAGRPAECVTEDQLLGITGEVLPYVSRGGLKLEKALKHWKIDLKDRVCMDVGASTGGFTDCMLQNGASFVYAVDVGTGQLHERLRNDPRVKNLEQTNIRLLKPGDTERELSFVSVDVSFISLSLVLPAVIGLLGEGGECVALIKPQFEAGKGRVGKKGVVRDRKLHQEVLSHIADVSRALGFSVLGMTFSPVRGPEGNIEYLIRLRKGPADVSSLPDLKELTEQAHKSL